MRRLNPWPKKAEEGGDSRQRRAQAALDDQVTELRQQLDRSQALLRDDQLPGAPELLRRQTRFEKDLQKYSVPPGLITRHTSRGFRANFPHSVVQHVKEVKKLSDELEDRRRGAISPLTDPRPFSFDESDGHGRSSTSPHPTGYRSHAAQHSYSSGGSFAPYSPGYNQSQFDFGRGANEDVRGPRRSRSHDYLRNEEGPSSSGGQGQSSAQTQPPRGFVFVPVSSQKENVNGVIRRVYYDQANNKAWRDQQGTYHLI